ncbi:MAG: putative rane protein found fused to lysyl-tRNA synthetase like protein [Frankiales bacterium]|nr:putative rane protein found fused to lysyl-tRNA synthetase like protein [Frankiales bacterium]
MRRDQRRAWVPFVAWLLCLAGGVLDLASAVTRGNSSRLTSLREYVPGGLSNVSTALTLVAGVLLVLVAQGLRRRKRRAWRVAVALLLGSVALHVLKGLDIEESAAAAALLVGLVAGRGEFYAKGDPRTRWRAVGAFLSLLLVSYGLGLAVVAFRDDAIVGPHSFAQVSEHVLVGLIGIHGPLQFQPDRAGQHDDHLIGDALLALGLLTAVTTAYLVLRPAEPAARLSTDDEARMRELLTRHGQQDSLGYFALRRDKSVLWSPSGKACVAYRVVSGVMLASGDPLGDPEAWPGAIEAFLATAEEHAWTPAVMGCSEQAGKAWCRADLTALEIGDEAVLEVAEFSLEGRGMRNVRQAVNRVERAGYTAQVCRVADISPEQGTALRAQAAAWRGTDTERGFSMALGRFGDPADRECVTVMAFQEDRLRAFLHFVPWGTDGLSLDLMRRDRDADNGLNELLIVSALSAAPSLGVTRLSLNFAVFRSALERGERLGAGPIIRAWRGFLLFASRWFQIESLYRFNAKFRPEWEPRYVCYPQARDLPRVALAALEAEAFLVWPRLPWSRTDRPR